MTIEQSHGALDHLGIEEQLMLCTTRIVATNKDGQSSFGTGFFVNFSATDDGFEPYVLTNKHVLKDAERVCLRLRQSRVKGTIDMLAPPYDIELPISELDVVGHVAGDVDLAAISFLRFHEEAGARGTSLNVAFWGMEDFASLADHIPSVADVLMVGYPIGLMDEVNNLPIVRRGITATPFAADFRGRTEFVVDMACFPGSSGSPVVFRKMGLVGGSVSTMQFRLMGVLYAGPRYEAYGDVVDVPAPTTLAAAAITPMMINLGYCIKATRILELRDLIHTLRASS